jgi:hypothetical protein
MHNTLLNNFLLLVKVIGNDKKEKYHPVTHYGAA